MYGSWDTEWDRQNYLSFWAIFCPFTPQTIWRYYHSGDIITLYLCTINDNHMMYASTDMECDRQNVIFLSFWTVFCPLPPPLTNWKMKILKNEKHSSRYHHFTLVYHKNDIRMMYDSWDMERDKQNFLSFWSVFCPFTTLTTQKIKIFKKWKKTWKYYHFTNVYHKWQS